MESEEDFVTIKVRRRVKNLLLEIQGLLQIRDHRRYSLSDIIEYLISEAPQLEVPLGERFVIVEPDRGNSPRPPQRRD